MRAGGCDDLADLLLALAGTLAAQARGVEGFLV